MKRLVTYIFSCGQVNQVKGPEAAAYIYCKIHIGNMYDKRPKISKALIHTAFP